jgi:hypothetical protein
MTERTNLAELYNAPMMEWETVLSGLDAAFGGTAEQNEANDSISWLTSINLDGSPHCTPVGAAWEGGAFWFQTGKATRKARNLGRDPRCTMARSLREFDLVVEGTAARVTDPEWVARLAQHWANRGWPAEPDDSGTAITAPYNAQSTGPGPWHIYRMELTSAFAVQKVEPGSATRWRF